MTQSMTRWMLAAVIAAAVVIASAGVGAVLAQDSPVSVVRLSVPSFNQCDSRWGTDQLGSCNGKTICSDGCAVTSVAMILKYYGVDTDPGDLNEWLKNNNGYAAGGCEIIWDKADDRSGGNVQWAGKYTTYPDDWGIYTTDLPSKVKSEIDQGYPCVGGLDGHFVAITGYSDSLYYINDPSYSRSTISKSSITRIYTYHSTLAGQKICIDPGHGGTDPGAVSYGLEEADVNLDVALRLRDLLIADGAIPIMTRDNDIDVSLQARCDIANNNNCDRFVSIHCNAFDGTAKGTETYCHPQGDSFSFDLRDKVNSEVVSHLGTYNRGVKTADYYVLRNTDMSAILTELAFIDNYSDSQILANPSYRQEAARAILHGLQAHYGETPHDHMVPIDIILDTDRSGSMSGQKIIDAKNAATLFVDLLESQDQVGLVSFSSSATLDSHLTSDFEHAKSVIAGYSASGSTNMGDALSKSIQELKTNGRDDTIWSIIYFTDGQTNAGLTKTEILDTLVPEAVDTGIIVYTLGYGSNVDEDFLRQVAEATGGKYYFAPDSAKLMEIYIELSQKIKGMEKIAEFTGIVSQGETKTETFVLESKTSFMRTFLIWPGSDLDLTVIDPSGNQIIPGPGVIYSGNDALPEYYEIYDPQIGEWTIEVYGKDTTGTTEDYTVMVFQPGALMQVKPTKWAVDYPLNRKMIFSVSEIAGNLDLTNVAFTASDLTETIVTSTTTSLMKGQAEAEERGEAPIATLTNDVYAQNMNMIPANCFSFTPNDFSVPAGESKNVEATLTLPSNSIPSGTYSGTINVSSDSGNSAIFVTVIVTSVGTATGTGTTYFASDAGTIEDLTALSESDLPEENPGADFPHGLFSFNITGLSNGATVNVTINFPQDIPTAAQYWKYNTSSGEWYQIPIGSNDGDNIITITLQDGGIGDNDEVENGIISDPGAPGVISTPPSAASTSAIGAPRYRYCVNEYVYAKGSGFTPGTNVNIYVVPDQDWDDGDPIPSDVTGSVETVSVNNGDVGPVLVWHAPLTPGSYDIVVDANRNGVYDALTDGLDSGSPGFIVLTSPPPTPPTDVPTLTPHGIIALVGLLCVIGVSRIRKGFN